MMMGFWDTRRKRNEDPERTERALRSARESRESLERTLRDLHRWRRENDLAAALRDDDEGDGDACALHP